MYYITNKIEQKEILGRVSRFYKYDYISLKDLDFSENFRYGIIFDESVTLIEEFIIILELCVNYFNDDAMNLFVTDKSYIKDCVENGFYPTIHIQKDDFIDKKALLDIINRYPIGDDWMGLSATNICAYSSSFKWIFSYDKMSETACFVSNDEKFLLKIKKQYKEMIDDPFIPIQELLKAPYNYAKDKKEFDELRIGKLKII